MRGVVRISATVAAWVITTCHVSAWHFVFLADSRSPDWSLQVNTQVVTELAMAISQEQPAFVIFGGDLVNFGGPAAYAEWTNAMAPVYAAGIPVYPLIGNHELTDVASFTNLFGPALPDNGPDDEMDRTYAIGYSNALVLILDQFIPNRLHQVNLEWVEAVLSTNTRPHVFAAGHLPAFKLYHWDCLDDSPLERDRFWNLLRRAGCRLYLCGHDHFYDRTWIDDGDGEPTNDLWQVVVGTAGGPLYPDGIMDGVNGPWNPVRVFHEGAFGYLRVDVDGNTVSSSWRRRIGTNEFSGPIDSFQYERHSRPMLAVEGTPARLAWFGPAVLQSGPTPGGPFEDVLNARSPHLPSGDGGKIFFRLRLAGAQE